ncbi:hypothetical protein GW17_00059407 [Ensete ventricosum]|nr:hypothetical protein GW17_00059407 [Ensete ventricosum]
MKREAVASLHSILVCCPITLLPLGFLPTSGVRFRTRNTWRLLRDETPGTYGQISVVEPTGGDHSWSVSEVVVKELNPAVASRAAFSHSSLSPRQPHRISTTSTSHPSPPRRHLDHPISRASPRHFRELHASELREAPQGARIRRYHAFVAAAASFARTWLDLFHSAAVFCNCSDRRHRRYQPCVFLPPPSLHMRLSLPLPLPILRLLFQPQLQ